MSVVVPAPERVKATVPPLPPLFLITPANVVMGVPLIVSVDVPETEFKTAASTELDANEEISLE